MVKTRSKQLVSDEKPEIMRKTNQRRMARIDEQTKNATKARRLDKQEQKEDIRTIKEQKNDSPTNLTFRGSIQAPCSPRKTRSIRRRQEDDGDFEGQLKCFHCHLFKPLDNLRECPKCSSPFHLNCLDFPPQTLEYLKTHPNRWACPRCIRCAAKNCGEYIAGPENRQCARCARAWHVDCLKKNFAQGEYPFTQWFCHNCTLIRLSENPQLDGNLTPPSKNPPNENPQTDWRHKAKLNLGESKRKSRVHNSDAPTPSPVPFKWKNKDINISEENEIYQRRMTRSNAIKSEMFELDDNIGMRKISSPNTSNKSLPIEEKLNLKAVRKREARMRHRGIEEDEEEAEENGEEDFERMRICTKNAQSNKMVSHLPNSPKTSKRAKATNKDNDDDDGFYEEQMRVLSEMGFNPEETGGNRNTHNQWLQFGQFVRFRPLYDSAYAQPIQLAPVIYCCEFCLTPMAQIEHFRSHVWFCPRQFPPGNEIYRNVNEGWNIFEVEGCIEPNYCRNLCLMAKLFLSSKTLYHEVETFTFYILTEITPRGCVIVGYFSKEKNPSKNNNLSCLLTLPSAQGKGYGKLLIDLSYQFSKREHKIGSPEHPLSDLGLLAYRSYWRSVLFAALRRRNGQQMQNVSIRELSIETAIHSYDIISTLLANDMLQFRNDNYYIDIGKALNATLPALRRRYIDPDQLQWDPPFEPNPYSKMNSYIAAD